MPVDLDELEADARWISDWFDDGDRVSMPPIGEFERVASAAPSLIAELREARKRIADLENGIRFISAGVPVLQDMLATLKMSGANKAAEMVECAARLLQPAKETP